MEPVQGLGVGDLVPIPGRAGLDVVGGHVVEHLPPALRPRKQGHLIAHLPAAHCVDGPGSHDGPTVRFGGSLISGEAPGNITVGSERSS